MARASSLEIREAAADQIRTFYTEELVGFPIQVEPRMVFNPSPPTVDFVPNSPARDADSAGFGEIDGAHRFYIRLRVSGDEDAQQELLYSAMDETDDLCLAFALTDDPTLNGYAASVYVDPPTGFELAVDITERPLMSVRWPVTIVAGHS